ncbi:hypothetical protein OG225_12205 [Nocardia sp. NBC_01377]
MIDTRAPAAEPAQQAAPHPQTQQAPAPAPVQEAPPTLTAPGFEPRAGY